MLQVLRLLSCLKSSVSNFRLGAAAAIGHVLENSIPLSIFPIQTDKFVFCFCGLPGRGKTHISRRLAGYLSFFHAFPVHVFNVAEYRQKMFGGLKDSDWFDPNNQEALKMRNECNKAAILDMISFISQHTHAIAILDSTNPTHQRREYLQRMVKFHSFFFLFPVFSTLFFLPT
jgi:6-phosphofructo-2-kinase/fructose-2,6-biphosphatase